jgi:hypothetical protein
VGVATVAADATVAAPAAVTAAQVAVLESAQASTASSDAHLNRGNGGAVTGNRPTAPELEVAVR